MAQLRVLTLVLTIASACALVQVLSATLPECPAFAGADDEPHRCECEIAESTGCRGVTPRFNWIIGLCDRPDPTLPQPVPGKLTPKGGYQCADPMRLNAQRPGPQAGPSDVDLRYIASYQWGNPCEVALAVACNVSSSSLSPEHCRSCVVQHEQQLRGAGCSPAELTQSCGTCSTALRTSRRTYGGVSERCGTLPMHSCIVCLAEVNQLKVMAAGCSGDDIQKFCERKWAMVPYSSFNTDATVRSVDLTLGGLEQPGGAALWTRGAYTPGVPGLGPPGMLFVISCQVCSQFAWFMVNQATLDRGPDAGKQQCAMKQDNCWGTASAGEIDFLETGFWDPNSYNTSGPDGSPNPNLNNSRHYVTGYNGAGRCMPVNKGVAGRLQGVDDPPKDSGGICSNNFFVDDGQPHVYAAVVDRRGATVYRDPDWPGLEATTAEPVLRDAQPKKPEVLTPPCNAGTGSCAINTPACLTDKKRNVEMLTPPLGQPDCMATSAPKEWGFCKCSQTDAQCDAMPLSAADMPLRRSRPPPPPVLPRAKIVNETTNLHLAEPPSPPPLFCCNVTSPDTEPHGTCYEFKKSDGLPAAGKLCWDPLCSAAKSWNECDHLNDTWGNPCVAQYDGHTDNFPFCGAGSSSMEVCKDKCIGEKPPPPPPAEAVFCTDCPDDVCVRRRIEVAAHFCADPSQCRQTEWPPGRLCRTHVCDEYEAKGQVSCEEAGCQWQDDGNVSVTYVDQRGVNHTYSVPKCGINTVGKKEADQRCSQPPQPACTLQTNWWDLFDDTGQMWSRDGVNPCNPEDPSSCDIVSKATCDQSVCPYPYTGRSGSSTCMPHPFVCCNQDAGECYEWDGQGGAVSCPDAQRHMGWNAMTECEMTCVKI